MTKISPIFSSNLPDAGTLQKPRSGRHSLVLHRESLITGGIKEPSTVSVEDMPLGEDTADMEDYVTLSKLLQEFASISSIEKAWIAKSENGSASHAMFCIGQPNFLANKKRTLFLSSHILKTTEHSVKFQWPPFPVEMIGVSKVVPSPSASKLLIVRNKENDSLVWLEIWGQSQLEKEIQIPQSVHGPLYTDGWFEGISWNQEETLIAYVAEEPAPPKPVFTDAGYKKDGSYDKDGTSWKGQGDWEEDWGETYSKKKRPTLFVLDINSGEVRSVEGIPKSLSAGQVVWAPSASIGHLKCLVFVGWSTEYGSLKTSRKLGIKYCYNRPCALYLVQSPFQEIIPDKLPCKTDEKEDFGSAFHLTRGISSAMFPRFSPDGKVLVFLSSKSAVDSGAHSATDSLHKIDWPADGKPNTSPTIYDVVPVVACPEDNCFPGIYVANIPDSPWLSDGCTMVLSSVWRCTQVILAVNVKSCTLSRITPSDSTYSWNFLALDGDNILALSSSPIDPPQVKYGFHIPQEQELTWNWLDVPSPLEGPSNKIRSLLSSHGFSILKIPVNDNSDKLSEGAKKPIESIFVSCINSRLEDSCKEGLNDGASNPLILILHGGPHSVSVSGYSKSLAFLSSLGYNLLIVNYRGSLGFGEEALQSLPGKIGCQDVNDVLAALDYVLERGLADRSKVAILGGSHGGFLTTHLIGQAPDRFAAVAVRNPVCNLALMVGITDIPDWCYFESYGMQGKKLFSEAASLEHLELFFSKSPIAHISKVKTPVLFILGAQDLRVPVSNGLQYARALKEQGVEVKIIMFPDDVHGIERPQSDFESFLNIGVWFKKYLK
ncbi:acylaminoacyl-peptidase protein [Dioscorea alata]|uniref:Acylaminoacyl-peptidase protein n=1 Tax=Dioscorea alata TaxID=55571 RepID=A0ACB7UY13_DIOAL|nr:acylaminoacyl-peptidase protein [Dioscorea alata]